MNGYGFRHAARMEWIKLRSVRSSWWLAIAAVVSMAAAGAGVGLGYRSHTPVATAAQILDNSVECVREADICRHDLHDRGVLTDAELAVEKAKILGGN